MKMPSRKKSQEECEIPTGLMVFAGIFIVGLIAQVGGIFVYRKFLEDRGIGFWETPGIEIWWEYVTGAWGGVLFLLGCLPWVVAVIWLLVSLMHHRTANKKAEG